MQEEKVSEPPVNLNPDRKFFDDRKAKLKPKHVRVRKTNQERNEGLRSSKLEALTPLGEVFKKYHSSKCGLHSYDRIYNQIFEQYKDKEINILEIGVGIQEGKVDGNTVEKHPWYSTTNIPDGAAARALLEYFPKAQYYGVDAYDYRYTFTDHYDYFETRVRLHLNNGSCNDLHANPRFHFHHINPADPGAADWAWDEGLRFDIIIEDSCDGDNKIKIFENFYPLLAPDGYYLMESLPDRELAEKELCDRACRSNVQIIDGDFIDALWDDRVAIIRNTADTIFIQIAAYRDTELVPTIQDCLSKAQRPENITFGICWQHADDEEPLDQFVEQIGGRFRYEDVHWGEAQGCAWARWRTQKMWKGEKYTLQVDSHSRWEPNWDSKILNMMSQAKEMSSKPVITGYCPNYSPIDKATGDEDSELFDEDSMVIGPLLKWWEYPTKLCSYRVHPHGGMNIMPHGIRGLEPDSGTPLPKKPVPARFMSGHMFFVAGSCIREIEYDPNFAHADEVNMSIRLYTCGYDLYHPHEIFVYHEYGRQDQSKVWDDITPDNQAEGKTENTWTDLDLNCRRKARLLYNMEDVEHKLDQEDVKQWKDKYGLGTERTLQDFENYAGVDFRLRIVHPDVMHFNGGLPAKDKYSDYSWRPNVKVGMLSLRFDPRLQCPA